MERRPEKMNKNIDKEISDILLKNALEEFVDEDMYRLREEYKDTEPNYSDKHKKTMEKIFKKSNRSISWKKGIQRAAMIVLAFILSGTIALQVEAVRIQVINWYYQLTDESIEIGVEHSDGDAVSIDSIYEISDDIIDKYNLSFEYEIKQSYIITKYKDKNDHYFNVEQHIVTKNWSLDNEFVDAKECIILGRKGLILEKDDMVMIWWDNGDYIFWINTNFDFENAEEIANSIVIK